MTYQLYGTKRSGSMIVELALAEIGVDYQRHEVSLDTDDQRQESYARLNPQRKIPTLITPEGETLTESAAIVLTLDERHPHTGLLPPLKSPDRAQAIRWLLFASSEIYPIVEINDYPDRFSEPDQASATREHARSLWRTRLSVLETAITGDPYLLASGFTVTDLYIAVVTRWAQQEEWRPHNVPRIERLTDAVSNRENCQPVWDYHTAR